MEFVFGETMTPSILRPRTIPLFLFWKDSMKTTQPVSIPSQSIWPLTGQTLHVSLETASEEDHILSPLQAKFDAETFSPNLVLRTWEPGDKFYPPWIRGKTKKNSRFFF